jgi:hypothetical protein
MFKAGISIDGAITLRNFLHSKAYKRSGIFVNEVQEVYPLTGWKINDKHFEVSSSDVA